jgi:hypothetical protein
MGKGRDKRKRKAKATKLRLPPRPETLPDPPPPNFDDPDAFILARLLPKPHRGSGAVAIPEPDEIGDVDTTLVSLVARR